MHATRSFRFRLLACLLVVLAAALFSGCSARYNYWEDSDKGVLLAEKLKQSKYAYLRYAQAEDEARRDGNAQAAATYREAKEKAMAQYNQTEKELSSYQANRGLHAPAK